MSKNQQQQTDQTVTPLGSPAQELEEMFAEMQPGYRVTVERLEPEWAAGHQGSWDFDPEEPVSVDWLKEKFGGRKIRCRIYGPNNHYKGQRTVQIDDYPKRRGIRLRRGSDGYALDQDDLEYENQNAQPTPPPAPSSDTKLLELIMAQNGNLQQLMMKQQHDSNQRWTAWLMERITALETGQRSAQVYRTPTEQLEDQFGLIEKLKQAVGLLGNGEDAKTDLMGSVAEKFLEIEAKKAETKLEIDKKRAEAELNVPPLPPPSPQSAPQSAPQSTTGSGVSNAELVALARQRLAQMTPEQRSEVLELLGEGLEVADLEDEELEDEELEDEDSRPYLGEPGEFDRSPTTVQDRQESFNDIDSDLLDPEDRAELERGTSAATRTASAAAEGTTT